MRITVASYIQTAKFISLICAETEKNEDFFKSPFKGLCWPWQFSVSLQINQEQPGTKYPPELDSHCVSKTGGLALSSRILFCSLGTQRYPFTKQSSFPVEDRMELILHAARSPGLTLQSLLQAPESCKSVEHNSPAAWFGLQHPLPERST